MVATAVLQLTVVCSNTHFLFKVQSRYSTRNFAGSTLLQKSN